MADITLINKTGARSKKGYAVIESSVAKNSFKYAGIDEKAIIGSVSEVVDNNAKCKICISGEGVLYSAKPVKKGDILRLVKLGDGLPQGTVVTAQNSDAPYLKVGQSLQSGRGLISCVLSPEYVYTTLSESGAPTINWDDIYGVPVPILSSIGGTGTANYLAKFTDTSVIGNSLIYDDGIGVGIGTTSLGGYKLNVDGSIYGNNLTIAPSGLVSIGDLIAGNVGVNEATEYGICGPSDNVIATWGEANDKYYYGVDLLVLDYANTRAGINNISPSYTFDVNGTGRFTGNLYAAANVGTTSFVSGFAGSGWQLTNASSIYTLTVDNLTVRGALTAYELDINKINSINGGMIISVANGTCTTVSGSNIYFDEDGTNKQIQFTVNDIVRAQQYTGEGIGSYIGQVTAVTHSSTYGSAYITCTTLSGTPWNGMELVQVGNASDTARQNLMYLTAADTNNPYLDILAGVNSSSFAGKTKARLGNLTGITDALYGSLSGYGLWSDNVYLSGAIKATSGLIGGWGIDTDAIYTGTKKTSAGYTTSGITLASNGSIRSKYFEIDTNGYAKFVSVDSIFNSTSEGVGDLSGTVAHTVSNNPGQPKIVDITVSGASGDMVVRLISAITGTTNKTMTFSSNINTTISNFISAYSADYLALGYTLSHPSTTVLRITGSNLGDDYIVSCIVGTGDLAGSVSTYQAAVSPVARIDTITLSGTSGIASILCDGVTSIIRFDFNLTTTASDFSLAYASSYSPGGVTVTSSGNDIILTSSTAGVDFAGSTTITNVPNTHRGSIKISGNNIWEDIETGAYSYIGINTRGYKGQTGNYYRSCVIGNGVGAELMLLRGYSSGSNTIGDIYVAAPQIFMGSIPTSSAATMGVGYLYVDGSGYIRMRTS